MTLGHISLLFLLQASFGSLLTFVVSDRQALGPKYSKFGGWVILGLLGLGGSLVWGPALAAEASTELRWLGIGVAAAGATTLGYASVAGWDRRGLETALLYLALVLSGATLAFAATVLSPVPPDDTLARTLVLASSLGSALVIGFTSWGMILGHWYLVSDGLDIGHLTRLVAPLPWMFLLKTAVSCVALALMWDSFLGSSSSLMDLMERSPRGPLAIVSVGARIPVGLVAPAVMALMTRVTVRMHKTQPATGILYAMCGLVYLGELLGASVLADTGVPF